MLLKKILEILVHFSCHSNPVTNKRELQLCHSLKAFKFHCISYIISHMHEYRCICAVISSYSGLLLQLAKYLIRTLKTCLVAMEMILILSAKFLNYE